MLLAEPGIIARTLRTLIPKSEIVEIRALGCRLRNGHSVTAAGYFDDFELAATEIGKLDAQYRPTGIYWTLNRINPACMARYANRFEISPKQTTTDADIVRRRWLLIDVDSGAVAGVSSSQVELDRAMETAEHASVFIEQALGWPMPIRAMSGNGAHLLYRIDEAATVETAAAIKRLYEALRTMYPMVDTSVHNAARICKLYGTIGRKGEHSEARPHRMALLTHLETTVLTSAEFARIDGLANQINPPRQRGGQPVRKPVEVETWCARQGLQIKRIDNWNGGQRFVLEHCAFDESHGGTSAAILQFQSGAVAYSCLHNSCNGKTWTMLREKYGDVGPRAAARVTLPANFQGLSNVNADGSARAVDAIGDEMFGATNDWPRMCGGVLFVIDSAGHTRWIDSSTAFFAWLQETMGALWGRGLGVITKEEYYEHVRSRAVHYSTMEFYPHYPPVEAVDTQGVRACYYRKDWGDNGDGAALDKFVSFFRPATDLDRIAIKALVLTLCWGGPPGSRPLFVVTAREGQGVGKTKFAEMCARLVGGAISMRLDENPDNWAIRLLTPGSRQFRVAILDNVKEQKIDSAKLEEFITGDVISGRQLHLGDGRRQNYLTYIMTLNSVGFSADLSTRAYVIELVKGDDTPGWQEDVGAWIALNRGAVMADIGALLRGGAQPTGDLKLSRWATWERHVLAHAAGPKLRNIIDRNREWQAACNEDRHIFATFVEELQAEIVRRSGGKLGENNFGWTVEPDEPPDKDFPYGALAGKKAPENPHDPLYKCVAFGWKAVAPVWQRAIGSAKPPTIPYLGRTVAQHLARGDGKIDVDGAEHSPLSVGRERKGTYLVWRGPYSDAIEPRERYDDAV